MLKVGVLLPSSFEDAGDFLADARALDAAGADSLWIDGDSHEPWLVLAAIASVTGRARLVAPVSAARASAPLEGDVRTLDRLSRGRLVLRVAGPWLPDLQESVTRANRRQVPVVVEAKEGDGAASPGASVAGLVFACSSPAACRAMREAMSRGTAGPVNELWALLPSRQGHGSSTCSATPAKTRTAPTSRSPRADPRRHLRKSSRFLLPFPLPFGVSRGSTSATGEHTWRTRAWVFSFVPPSRRTAASRSRWSVCPRPSQSRRK